ncbi:hypothetical protein K3I73_004287 [Shigella flexneri]|nr:hypothetical protein [Shigella flexneri]
MQQRLTQDLTQFLASLPEDDRIKAINEIRMAIHQVSPEVVNKNWPPS